ncbi:MAG: CopG family transcriptional regulator [Thermoprotei archaeon]|nr:MAG: CopG family transcriptional regulator [Thermoprotei archaeon]
MSVVISVRIPRKLKEKMDSLRNVVNWSEEFRRFLERRVKELYREKVLRDVRRVIEMLPEVPKGTVTGYVREDRDSH